MIAEDGIDVDLLPLEVTFSFAPLARMDDRERDRSSLVAAKFLHGFVAEQAVGAFAVDFEDSIAGQQARPVGGRAEHRAQDLQLPVVHGDLDADAAELAFYAAAEAAQLVRSDVAGIGIELAQYAADGRLRSARGGRSW